MGKLKCSLCGNVDCLSISTDTHLVLCNNHKGRIMSDKVKFYPRNDHLLIEIVDVELSKGGVAIPQTSMQGKRFIVREVGADVEDVERGDEVMLAGQRNVTYFEIPQHPNMIVTKQEHAVLKIFRGDNS